MNNALYGGRQAGGSPMCGERVRGGVGLYVLLGLGNMNEILCQEKAGE